MASKQTEALNALYRGWAAALQANLEMPLDVNSPHLQVAQDDVEVAVVQPFDGGVPVRGLIHLVTRFG